MVCLLGGAILIAIVPGVFVNVGGAWNQNNNNNDIGGDVGGNVIMRTTLDTKKIPNKHPPEHTIRQPILPTGDLDPHSSSHTSRLDEPQDGDGGGNNKSKRRRQLALSDGDITQLWDISNRKDGGGGGGDDTENDGSTVLPNSIQTNFWEIPALQKLWKIPTTDPIPFHLWGALSNTTCVESIMHEQEGRVHWRGLQMASRMPLAIVVGAQKGGSTALGKYLSDHPNIINYAHEQRFFDTVMDDAILLTASSSSSSFSTSSNSNSTRLDNTDRNRGNKGNGIRFGTATTAIAAPSNGGGGIDRLYFQQLYQKELQNNVWNKFWKKRHQQPPTDKEDNNDGDDKKTRRMQGRQDQQTQKQSLPQQQRTNDEMLGEDHIHGNSTSPHRPHDVFYFIDKTPTYMMLTDRIPKRIQCLSPNPGTTKLLAVLRHPIDRAYSQYNMFINFRRFRKHFPSFDDWIMWDYEVLMSLGVLRRRSESSATSSTGPTTFLPYLGTVEEKQGWDAYVKLVGSAPLAPIGRGLYSLQLLQWQEAYEPSSPLDDLPANKQHHNQTAASSSSSSSFFKDQMLVLQSESFRTDPQQVHDRVCDFLNLPRHVEGSSNSSRSILGKKDDVDPAGASTSPNDIGMPQLRHNTGNYTRATPMSNSTRALLEQIFEPYNRQLVDVLGEEWRGIWEVATDQNR